MKKPDWLIRIGRKDQVAEVRIPKHRLGEKQLAEYLRAVVSSMKSESQIDQVNYYLNDRKGAPGPSLKPRVINYFNYEHRWSGLWCGDWEHYAMGVFEIDQKTADTVHQFQNQNRKGV